MTYGTGTLDEFAPFERASRSPWPGVVPIVAALASGASLGFWMVHALPAAPKVEAPTAAVAWNPYGSLSIPDRSLERPPAAALTPPTGEALAAASAASVGSNPYGALPGPASASSSQVPAAVAQSSPPKPETGQASSLSGRIAVTAEPESVLPVPRPADPQVAAGVPLPKPRPPELQSPANRGLLRPHGRQMAQQGRAAVPAAAPPDNRNFFEKLFGLGQPAGPALAYASPQDGARSRSQSTVSDPAAVRDRWTAVYDISAHTVYMPDGTKLEAHSGLGDRLDDPAHVSERDRGATPPHLYELEAREELFHGVQAIRLNPVGGGGVYGRTGLLAHTYMLGPNGDSNGCVSFKNYDAFLQAFQRGEVKRLAVVARSS